MKKVCVQCGKTFDAAAGRVKLCSRECVNKWLLGRKKKSKANLKNKQVIEKQCEYCGNIFTIDGLKHHKDKKFCSRKCMYNAQKKRENIHCAYCGKEFYPYEKDARYCSLSCSAKAQSPEKVKKRIEANAERNKAKRLEKEQKKREKQRENEEKQRKKIIKKYANATQYSMTVVTCKWCGNQFITMKQGKQYCTDRCMRSAMNKRHEMTRRMRTMKNFIEDVSLPELYKRDGGICHICGLPCRYDDYTVVDDVFIAGNYYPSIDHVKPLAKGGEHSYKNVKLAHRICNTIKRDKDNY